MISLDGFYSKKSFWNKIKFFDKEGVLRYTVKQSFFNLGYGRVDFKTYRASNANDLWMAIRNMSGSRLRIAIYEIIDNNSIVAKIKVENPLTVVDKGIIEILDINDTLIGKVKDDDERLRGLSNLVYGSFTLCDNQGNTLANIKHHDHDATVKLSHSSQYNISTPMEIDEKWERVLVGLTVLATVELLKLPAPGTNS